MEAGQSSGIQRETQVCIIGFVIIIHSVLLKDPSADGPPEAKDCSEEDGPSAAGPHVASGCSEEAGEERLAQQLQDLRSQLERGIVLTFLKRFFHVWRSEFAAAALVRAEGRQAQRQPGSPTKGVGCRRETHPGRG